MLVKSIWKRQLYEKQNYFKNLIGFISRFAAHPVLLNFDTFRGYNIFDSIGSTNALLFISERTTEVEREIERQRLLELERAKTRELRHQLDMEKEKQSQARPHITD